MINLETSKLIQLSTKPKLYTAGEKLFWNDPYIAEQMLKAHLDGDTDRASYRPKTIDAIVNFTIKHLDLKKGNHILDTGCGPGLYCQRFSQAGLNITGLDMSLNSINYAKESANKKGLNINYVNGNYLDMNYENEFDAICIISQDFCVLNPQDRAIYLDNVYKSLKPNGYLILDTSTPNVEDSVTEHSSWYACESGFWSPEKHLVLENRFYYPDVTTYLNQFVVATDIETKIYRIYQTHYTMDSISQLLSNHGFESVDIFNDLTGCKYTNDSTTLGVIAQKR